MLWVDDAIVGSVDRLFLSLIDHLSDGPHRLDGALQERIIFGVKVAPKSPPAECAVGTLKLEAVEAVACVLLHIILCPLLDKANAYGVLPLLSCYDEEVLLLGFARQLHKVLDVRSALGTWAFLTCGECVEVLLVSPVAACLGVVLDADGYYSHFV